MFPPMPRRPAVPLAEVRRLLRLARTLTAEAAARIVPRQRRLGRPAALRKGVGDFVTVMDLRTERSLRRALRKAHPEAGFIGEETGHERPAAEFVWVVDPIDGTSNFASGLPTWAVAVACLHRGRPLTAAMWCEPEGALYWAGQGLGAFRQGRRLRMATPRRGDAAVIGCQWHRGQQDLGFLAAIQREGGRIRTLGSTVVQCCDLVMGRLDGNVQQQGRPWDLVAPGLLLEEAGGRLTDWQGRPVFPLADPTGGHTATIAGAPAAHRRLLAVLRAFPDPNRSALG